MESRRAVVDLIRAGRFLAALELLEEAPGGIPKVSADVLRAELLERTGQSERSRALVTRLLRVRELEPSERAVCEFVMGQLEWETGGDTEAAVVHVQRAVALADSAKDTQRACLFRLRLMVMVADRSGPLAIVPLLAQLRTDAVMLGDPIVSAALHVFVGETEAKQGLRRSAERHARLGQALLASHPNLWLDALAENTLVANLIMVSDIETGIISARRALDLAQESGAASMQRACLGNLGNLHYLAGQFPLAVDYFERAAAALPSSGERSNACFDSLARICLSQGRAAEAKQFLLRVDASIRTESDWLLYANRHSRLTYAEILNREAELMPALTQVDFALNLAMRASDHFLFASCLLVKAEILARLRRIPEATSILAAIATDLAQQPTDFHAQYEMGIGSALASGGDLIEASKHFARAQRIYRQLHNVPRLLDVEAAMRNASHSSFKTAGQTEVSWSHSSDGPSTQGSRQAGNAMQSAAALMLHVGRPELLASDVIAILEDTGCVASAEAAARASDGSVEILSTYGSNEGSDAPERVFELGIARNRTIVVIARPRPDVESTATLNAVTLLLGTIRDLERANAEREERLTLWPLEDDPIENENAIIKGHMRELMTFARRVAKTNIGVLLTGESGTGKEILARAIHTSSARADKPFVPFNCTAVPREMLESQLFGHRRGAFTSADRDNPGLIRAAKGGTLFLDEIGELGLDLQPKLLRFLESGEINPLGEPNPFNVDVRIVAATNRDLEQLVQEGRFREDLFYRLNVIRLTILPLRERRDEIPALAHHFVARAAAEFAKGRLRIAEETMEHFLLYPWPGNVRQLQNEIRRMAALADVDSVLTPAALSHDIRRSMPRGVRMNSKTELAVQLTDKLMPTLSHIEREMIRAALRASHGRVDAAAKALGISRKGLYLKRQRLGL
jgi:DNA-binding NtrC family response regulator/tetratricopeptide (TPR) repeat protein